MKNNGEYHTGQKDMRGYVGLYRQKSNYTSQIFDICGLCMHMHFQISRCCCSVTKSYLTFCDPMNAACQASFSFTISQSLLKLKLMSIESVIPFNHFLPFPLSPLAFSLSQQSKYRNNKWLQLITKRNYKFIFNWFLNI